MMADLKLDGLLNLMGNLTLKASGGKVKVGDAEALVQVNAPAESNQGTGTPVILPPPPAPPLDEVPKVWIISSFNQTVTVGSRPVVALGMVMEGGKAGPPTWPGMMLPSKGNKGPVSVNHVPINVLGDQAVIFPTGAPANLNMSSGQ
jgi:hypothetical protein